MVTQTWNTRSGFMAHRKSKRVSNVSWTSAVIQLLPVMYFFLKNVQNCKLLWAFKWQLGQKYGFWGILQFSCLKRVLSDILGLVGLSHNIYWLNYYIYCNKMSGWDSHISLLLNIWVVIFHHKEGNIYPLRKSLKQYTDFIFYHITLAGDAYAGEGVSCKYAIVCILQYKNSIYYQHRMWWVQRIINHTGLELPFITKKESYKKMRDKKLQYN